MPLDQNWIYLAIAVLAFWAVVFAISRGRSVKLWFRKAGLQVGEDKNRPTATQGAAGQSVSVANHSKISGSNVSVHVGNSVTYQNPEAGEEKPHK